LECAESKTQAFKTPKQKNKTPNELSTSWITQVLTCTFGFRSLNYGVDADLSSWIWHIDI